MNTSTRKIECYPLNDKYKKRLKDLAYACRRMSNIAITQVYAFEKFNEYLSITDEGKEVASRFVKGDLLKTSRANMFYKELSVQFKDIPSTIRAGLTRRLQQTYAKARKEIHTGRRSLPTFRDNQPIPFNINARYKDDFFQPKDNNYEFSPFGPNDVRFSTRLGRDQSNNKHIIESIIAGHYQLCDSSILCDSNKFYLLLTFKSPARVFEKDEDRVVSMNLGMNCPAYVVCNNGQYRMIGNKDTFLHQRLSLQHTIKRIQKGLRYVHGGKGRAKKMQALNRFRLKERNFVQTKNHQISHEIIKFAVQNNASKILIEDLSGIAQENSKKKQESENDKKVKNGKSKKTKKSKKINQYVLRNWSYFELQQFITYKAKQYGIEVIKLTPEYISQKCHKCGHISNESLQKEEFVCVSCDHSDHKDKNASLNLLASYEKSIVL